MDLIREARAALNDAVNAKSLTTQTVHIAMAQALATIALAEATITLSTKESE